MPYATRFDPGKKYYCRYQNWHVDPAPYLFVIWSRKDHTIGFNLHYLPNIRFNIPLEIFRRVQEQRFAKAFENMKKAGMFRGFLDLLDRYEQGKQSYARSQAFVDLVTKRHPWAMQAFRNYKTNQLRIRE